MNDRVSELRRRFVEGLLVGMQVNDLHEYVTGEDEDDAVGF